MPTTAKGTFTVKITPITQDVTPDEPHMGRMSIDKQFGGDLEGTGKGQMLTGMTDVKGSAGYVAIEKVTGSLQGRKGTFLLQHTGVMHKGQQSLSIIVIPDSGTDELTGLSGTLNIVIEDGQHYYEITYDLT